MAWQKFRSVYVERIWCCYDVWTVLCSCIRKGHINHHLLPNYFPNFLPWWKDVTDCCKLVKFISSVLRECNRMHGQVTRFSAWLSHELFLMTCLACNDTWGKSNCFSPQQKARGSLPCQDPIEQGILKVCMILRGHVTATQLFQTVNFPSVIRLKPTLHSERYGKMFSQTR